MFRNTKLWGMSMARRQQRRRLVIVVYAVLALIVSVHALRHPGDPFADASFYLVLMIVLISRFVFGALVLPNGFPPESGVPNDTRGPEILSVTDPERSRLRHLEPPPPPPDERDIAMRNESYYRAFNVIATYSVLIWLASSAFLGPHVAWQVRGALILNLAFFPVLVMACTLPQALMLWSEPDLLEEERP